jgi:DNA-binding transcriptional ArsR family regulator
MLAATDSIAALGDPTRRGIFEIVSIGPVSVGDIAKRLPVTRPAVSQHLRVLKDAGLVTSRTSGTRHLYQLEPSGIAALRDYFDALWQKALANFKEAAERSFEVENREKEN